MSNSNTDKSSQRVAKGMKDKADKGVRKGIKKTAKGAKKLGKRVFKVFIKSVMKLVSIGGVFGAVLFIVVAFMVLLTFVILPTLKVYSPLFPINSKITDVTENYTIDTSVLNQRSSSGLKGASVLTYTTRTKLNEENQAIENYHYYNSTKSKYNNKYYIPVKGIDLKTNSDEEIYKILKEKGVILEDKESEELVFNKKFIGDLKKVDDENLKLIIKDSYKREEYFQIPEELLSLLNSNVYLNKVIYDKPFLQGVQFKYRKTDETVNGIPNYEYDLDSYSARKGKLSQKSGIGSVYVYRPSLEISSEPQEDSEEVEENSGENAKVDGLVYMGDSLFVGIKNNTDVDESQVVAVIGDNLIKGFKNSLPKVVEKKPKYVVMDYGTNDKDDGIEKFKERYIDLINELKKQLPDTKLYLTKLYNSVSNFNPAIDEIAKETGCTVIDSSHVFKDKSYFEPDTLHYTPKGYKAWNDDILKQIGLDKETPKARTMSSSEEKEIDEDKKIGMDEANNIKLTYVLDRVITFAGVYKFEYKYKTSKEGSSIIRKEEPTNVKRETTNDSYIQSYLNSFRGVIPKDVYTNFQVRKLVTAFKGTKGSITSESEAGSGEGGLGTSGGGSLDRYYETTRREWTDLCKEIAKKYGIDYRILLTIIQGESTGDIHYKQKDIIAGTHTNSHRGLVQLSMKGDSDFDADKVMGKDNPWVLGMSKDGRVDSRFPRCYNGPHNEEEHKEVGRNHIEYLARRISGNIGYLALKVYNIDYRKEKVPDHLMQGLILGAMVSYNAGDAGFQKVLKLGNGDLDYVVSNDGKVYASLLKKAGIAGQSVLEPHCKNYPYFADGASIYDNFKTSNYDQSKWFEHIYMPKRTSSVDSSGSIKAEETTWQGTDGNAMDIDKIKEYMEYEEGKKAKIKSNSVVVTKIPTSQTTLILNQSISMIEESSSLNNKNSNVVFWKEGYEKLYFREGKAIKPPPGYNMEAGIWQDKIEDSRYTGDRSEILKLAKNYGQGMFKVINRLIGQMGKPYKEGSSGTMSYDMAGLIWYGFNYSEKKPLFELGDIEKYSELFQNMVEKDDLRPGDISFFAEVGDDEKKITDAIIYVGNDAGIYVSEEYSRVELVKYSDFIRDEDSRVYVDTRRILKFTRGLASEIDENKAALEGNPAGFVEGDFMFPIKIDPKVVRILDRVGIRAKHPYTSAQNKPHLGVDYGTNWAAGAGSVNGAPVLATKAGKVIKSTESYGTAGVAIILDHLDGTTSAYFHLQYGSRKVEVGDDVKQGQQIGLVGSTGYSTGPHLHFEIAVGLPGHSRAKPRDRKKYVRTELMFKELNLVNDSPKSTVYPGNEADWNN